MPNESKTLTAQRIRKERALANAAVEAAWAGGAIIRLRRCDARDPERVRFSLADPRHAEAIIRVKAEIALKQLKADN
jgi:hypothetical protein